MKIGELIQLRTELVESIGDESRMKHVLTSVSELSNAEFCAFYTERHDDYFYITLESRELTTCIPEIKEKLKTAYRMFTNRPHERGSSHENVYYLKEDMNIAVLMGDVRVESYFIVPVICDSVVRGVLFLGSPRKDAFNRNDILTFSGLAEEGRGASSVVPGFDGASEILYLILDAVPYGAALLSPDGRIKRANDLFGAMLQTDRAHPETIYEVGHVSQFNVSGIWEEFRAVDRNYIERELHSSGNTERSIAVTLVKLSGVSEDFDVLALLRDTTVLHEQERAKEEVLATVAHEIRTPMTALKNSLGIILESTSRRTTYCDHRPAGAFGGEKRFLEMALRTISRLEMIVDGLIDISAVRKADRPLELDLVNVREFLEEASLLFIENMQKKGIQFEIAVDERASEVVFDRNRMEQIIQNLLANAMKNVPSDGSISITVSLIDEAIESMLPLIPWKYLLPPRFVDMCVSDTGIGIPREVIEDINPLPDRRGGRRRPARGLGLYIAKKLMQQHGGVLVAERTEDGGSAVHLYLPKDQKTRSIIQTVYVIDEGIDKMIDRGLSPVLYALVRVGNETWADALGRWETKPVFNPEKEEIGGAGVYLWPLNNSFAMALTAEKRYVKEPSLLTGDAGGSREPLSGPAGERLRIGWAVGPRDGTSYSALVAVSLGRAVEEMIAVT